MKFNLIKMFTITFMTSTLLFSTAYAQTQKTTDEENIDVTQQNITKEELAAIYVLSEICPTLVEDQDQFTRGYSKLVHEYMPNQKNAVEALEKMSKETSFNSVLKEAKQDAKNAGTRVNTDVCADVSGY